jgi:hypothetical protein
MERTSPWCSSRQNRATKSFQFEHAARLNFEDIISSNAAAPYRSERNEGRLKSRRL